MQGIKVISLGLSVCLGVLGGCASSKHAVFEAVKGADTAYDQGHWARAEQGYRTVIEKAPDDAYAWFRLGNVQLQQGRYAGAIEAYQAVLSREPDWVKAHYNLSTVYLLQAQSILESGTDRANVRQRTVMDARRASLAELLYTPGEPTSAVVASATVVVPEAAAEAVSPVPRTSQPKVSPIYQGWKHTRFRSPQHMQAVPPHSDR